MAVLKGEAAMSTTAATAPSASIPATEHGQRQSPVEYVKGLPPEDKQAVFLALLREALQINGDRGLMPVEDEDGKSFGYYVPPQIAAAHAQATEPKLTPEREAELARRQREV